MAKGYYVSSEELAAINKVQDLLIRLQETFDEKDALMSTSEGDVIKIEELARVRGIMDFFEMNQPDDVILI